MVLTFLALSLSLIGIMSAATCDVNVALLNQDPYPAIPGEYVKVVFQITGLENTACGTVTFGVKEEYPISLDPDTKNPITINSGTFKRDYGSSFQAPFRLRMDENALDGENPIEVYYSTAQASNIIKQFNINVEDTRANFEINVKEYDYATRALTFEILNIEKTDVQALTLEIPKQDSITVKGTNRVVVGDLDSNEYTTADFEVILPEGESRITLNILYTDSANVRRETQKVVDFDSSYFTGREIKKKTPWAIIVVVVVVIAFLVWRRIVKKKREEEERRKRHSA